MERLLYIVHAADDKALAQFVKSQVEATVPALRIFLASKPGQIPTGSDWLAEIQGKLTDSTEYLLLLTPRSITRHWVWYEAGAAWMTGRSRYPVAAGGLARQDIPFPLGAAQTLALDDPDEATQLFTDLGGSLEAPEEFCRVVRALSLPLSPRIDEKRAAHVRQSVGALGEPPKLILRRMLARGTLTSGEMAEELRTEHFPSDDANYVARALDAIKQGDLVQGDADGRWGVGPEIQEIVRESLNPPLSIRMKQLSEDILTWLGQGTGLIDSVMFEERFGNRLQRVRDKVAVDHAEGDDWLYKIPSSASGAKQIALKLAEVARRLP